MQQALKLQAQQVKPVRPDLPAEYTRTGPGRAGSPFSPIASLAAAISHLVATLFLFETRT